MKHLNRIQFSENILQQNPQLRPGRGVVGVILTGLIASIATAATLAASEDENYKPQSNNAPRCTTVNIHVNPTIPHILTTTITRNTTNCPLNNYPYSLTLPNEFGNTSTVEGQSIATCNLSEQVLPHDTNTFYILYYNENYATTTNQPTQPPIPKTPLKIIINNNNHQCILPAVPTIKVTPPKKKLMTQYQDIPA